MSHRALGPMFDGVPVEIDGVPVEIRHEHWKRETSKYTVSGLSVIASHPKFGDIGRMELGKEKNGGREITDFGVLFRRIGVGTAMYKYAQDVGLNPLHSADRTDEGDAWAKKVGGDLPPRSERFR